MSKLDENYKSTNPRSSVSLKHKKHEENYTKAYHNQIVKIRDKEKILKAAWGERTHPIKKSKDEDDSRFFSSDTMQAGRATSLKYRRKKTT